MKKIITIALASLLLFAMCASIISFAESASERDGWQHTGDHVIGNGLYVSIYAMTRDEFNDEFEHLFMFDVENRDFAPQLNLFVPNRTLRDFRWINPLWSWLSPIIDGESEVTCDGIPTTLYSAENISPENPFVFEWIHIGTFSHRGFSFTDDNGETQYFIINEDMSASYDNHFGIWRANANPHVDESKITLMADGVEIPAQRSFISTRDIYGVRGSGQFFHHTQENIVSLPVIYDPRVLGLIAAESGVLLSRVEIQKLTEPRGWDDNNFAILLNPNDSYAIRIPAAIGEHLMLITIIYSDFEHGYQEGIWRENTFSEFTYAFRVVISEEVVDRPDDNSDYNGVDYPEQPDDDNGTSDVEPPNGDDETPESSNLPMIIGISAAAAIALIGAIIFIVVKKQT